MRRKVLIIDESAMLRRVASNVLQAPPGRHEVLLASRAVEGFASACVGGVDLILVDHLLAGLADAQLCRRLLSDTRTAGIPVVLMIGQSVRPPLLSGLPANVVDTLTKPFSPEHLVGMVNGIFKLRLAGCSLAELRENLHPGICGEDCAEVVATESVSSAAEPINGRGPVPAPRSSTQGSPAPGIFVDHSEAIFSGDTAVTPLRAVLHEVASTGDTGILRLWPESGESTELLFDSGKLIVVTTRDGTQYGARAAEFLPGKVSPATVEEAIAEQNANGTPFLLTLGTRGLLSKSAAVSLLHRFGLRQFGRLLAQRARPPLRFDFRRVDTLPPYAFRLDPPTLSLDQWLLESTRSLRTEDLMVNLRHEGSVGSPYFQADAQDIVRNLALTESEQAFLQAVNGRTDLPTLAKALRTTQEALYLLTFRFRCLDVLSYRTAPAAFVMTPRAGLRRVLPLHR